MIILKKYKKIIIYIIIIMGKISHKEKPIEQRLNESNKIIKKYPERVCVYVEKKENCLNILDIDKHKYLVPCSIPASQFIFILRNKIDISKEQGLFFYANKTIIAGNITMGEYYNKYKSEDGFLYVKYNSESVFG